MSNRRDRERRPGRRVAFLDPKPVILVVCEGEVTEKQYIEGFGRRCENARVRVKISNQHGVPRTLVEWAKALKNDAELAARGGRDENLAFDSVWCVFDVDEHPNISDAKQMARDNEIELAISNPCFELWLLLHFRESPGMSHRETVQAVLREHVPEYEKHINIDKFMPHYRDAVKRAISLERLAQQINDPGRNPTTGVHKLLKEIEDDKTE